MVGLESLLPKGPKLNATILTGLLMGLAGVCLIFGEDIKYLTDPDNLHRRVGAVGGGFFLVIRLAILEIRQSRCSSPYGRFRSNADRWNILERDRDFDWRASSSEFRNQRTTLPCLSDNHVALSSDTLPTSMPLPNCLCLWCLPSPTSIRLLRFFWDGSSWTKSSIFR